MADETGPGREWIDAGLRALRREGVAGVRVERLAAELHKTKGSFYWHFADRAALLAAMREAWLRRATQAVIAEVEARAAEPRARLIALFAMTLAADGGLERAMRDWARIDAPVGAAVAGVDARRMRYVEGLLASSGLGRAVARRRARFAYQALLGRFAMQTSGPAQPRAAVAEARALADWLLTP